MTSITTDEADDISNYTVSFNNKNYEVLAVTDASVFPLDCPVCESKAEGNEIATLNNGQYLYIGKCCGIFTHCEVTQVVTGDGNE